MQMSRDEHYMKQALSLAEKALYRTNPNPAVGCIIVKDRKIIGTGYHKKAGTDHAEIAALKSCKLSPKNATMYVTLEPCHHFGRTPPCVDAIIKAGIAKVVIAIKDPNPLTSGKSIKKLRQHSIGVELGVLEDKAKELNKEFFTFMTKHRPYIYLKAA